MTDNIVDLATERAQRRILAERAAEGSDAFISGLQSAGQSLANLGWLLAAPVRAHDRVLTNGIYQVVLNRLGQIIDDAVAEGDWASRQLDTTQQQAKTVAFTAFAARMVSLVKAAADDQGRPSLSDPVA